VQVSENDETSEAIYTATMAGVMREFCRVAIGDPLVVIYRVGCRAPSILSVMRKMERHYFAPDSETSDQYQFVMDNSWHHPECPLSLFVMPARFTAELARRCVSHGIALVRGVPTKSTPHGFDWYDPGPALWREFGITVGAHVYTCEATLRPLDGKQLACVKSEASTRGMVYSAK
jgi:hypothetical protein